MKIELSTKELEQVIDSMRYAQRYDNAPDKTQCNQNWQLIERLYKMQQGDK